MKNKDRIKELLLKLSNKYNISIEVMEEYYFLYFEILKRLLLDGRWYTSRSFGKFYGTLKYTKQIPPGVKITPFQFYWLYQLKFKPSGEWAFRAGEINTRDLFEYCSRVLTPCPKHDRKWFDPSYCSYIDKYDSPVPDKMLAWRAKQKEKMKKDKK